MDVVKIVDGAAFPGCLNSDIRSSMENRRDRILIDDSNIMIRFNVVLHDTRRIGSNPVSTTDMPILYVYSNVYVYRAVENPTATSVTLRHCDTSILLVTSQ